MLGEFIVNCEEDGFPDHASRGFEAITYVLNGAVCHEDFAGNYGIVNKDCVQVICCQTIKNIFFTTVCFPV